MPTRVPDLLRKAQRLLARRKAPRAAPAAPRPPFGVEWARAYLPHYFPSAPAGFHGELFERLRGLHLCRDSKEAVIAPREGAKSTVVTLAYVLHCALEGHEAFTLILSDSAGQAEDQLRHIRHELEANDALARDYPDAAGAGPVWRQDRIELNNGAAVAALGTGGRIRGRRMRESRPSLIVFDDVENNTTITSAAHRERAWRWATREVLPAGTHGTNFLSVGSALHREAVAVRLGQLPGWCGRTYPAVLSWPRRMDLWAEWERRATNLADPDRGATAERFYAANRTAMDAGGRVYWPARWPLVAIMERRAQMGEAAFASEYQGMPGTLTGAEFPAEYFNRPDLWFDQWPTALVYRIQSLDPSKGSDAKTGDYQAHVLVGVTKNGDIGVEAVLAREPIARMVDRAIDLADLTGFAHAEGRLDSLVVENNDGLGMLKEEFNRRTRELNRTLPLEHLIQAKPKVVRVRRLGLYFGRNQVRFRNTTGTRLLVDQLRDFPLGDFDDGPDALELAIGRLERIARKPFPRKR